MALVNTNDPDDTTSFNDLAVSAYFFYRCSYFHLSTPNQIFPLFIAVCNSSPAQIIGGNFYSDPVSRQDFYKMHAHFS